MRHFLLIMKCMPKKISLKMLMPILKSGCVFKLVFNTAVLDSERERKKKSKKTQTDFSCYILLHCYNVDLQTFRV